jgi:hypothetical protein
VYSTLSLEFHFSVRRSTPPHGIHVNVRRSKRTQRSKDPRSQRYLRNVRTRTFIPKIQRSLVSLGSREIPKAQRSTIPRPIVHKDTVQYLYMVLTDTVDPVLEELDSMTPCFQSHRSVTFILGLATQICRLVLSNNNSQSINACALGVTQQRKKN